MGTAPRMPGGRNLPKVLQVPFCFMDAWVTASTQMDGKTRIWLFGAYNTATISISYISPYNQGTVFYTAYGRYGEVIVSTTKISSTGSFSINTSKVEYIEITGRAASSSAYAVGTLTATR